jgi:hypothetical protein
MKEITEKARKRQATTRHKESQEQRQKTKLIFCNYLKRQTAPHVVVGEVVVRLYQELLYCQNVSPFYGARGNAIVLLSKRKPTCISLRRFSRKLTDT